jgi:hypothetical protein
MLRRCEEPGCSTLVLGAGRCLRHEPPVRRVFPRGRPFGGGEDLAALAARIASLSSQRAALLGVMPKP